MAVPTISTVAPTSVWTGGQLVTITGTNFRLPIIPNYALSAPYPDPLPTVRVTVGSAAATEVTVLSTTQLTCILPAHDPGAAAVTVANLNDAGVAITGETATRSSAVTYARPDLSSTGEPDLVRLTRQILRDLRREILDNVVMYTHTDYDQGTFDVTELATLPALALSGPDVVWMTRDPARRSFDPYYTSDASDVYEHPAPLVIDVEFGVTGFTDNVSQLITLQTALLMFLQRHTYIEFQMDPADASKGSVRLPLRVPLGGVIKNTTVANPSNIRSFTGTFAVQSINIEELQSFPGESIGARVGVVENIIIVPTRI